MSTLRNYNPETILRKIQSVANFSADEFAALVGMTPHELQQVIHDEAGGGVLSQGTAVLLDAIGYAFDAVAESEESTSRLVDILGVGGPPGFRLAKALVKAAATPG